MNKLLQTTVLTFLVLVFGATQLCACAVSAQPMESEVAHPNPMHLESVGGVEHSLHHIMPEDQGEYCATGEGLSDCSTRQEFKPQQSQKSERFANSFTDFEPVFAALINEILAFPPSSSWPVQALFTHAVVDVSPVELKTRLLN